MVLSVYTYDQKNILEAKYKVVPRNLDICVVGLFMQFEIVFGNEL